MFHVLVRNKMYCPMDTSKESGKNCSLFVVRLRRSTGILQQNCLLCLCLFLCIFHFKTSLLNTWKKESNTGVEHILILL